MNARLTHIRLLVRDFAACERFYSDVMGFKPRFADSGGIYQEYDAGGPTLALFGRASMAMVVGTGSKSASSDAQDTVALCFAVDNVDKANEELRMRGAKFLTEPHDQTEWMIRVAHLRDPDGNLIEINARLPKRP